jgi:hypothetical protein
MSKFPVVYPPGPLKKRYTVSCYDRWEYPDDDAWYDRGEFDEASEAIALAHRVVRESLEHIRQQKPNADAEELRSMYASFGEAPVIVGEPRVPFNASEAARWHIRRMTRGAAVAP